MLLKFFMLKFFFFANYQIVLGFDVFQLLVCVETCFTLFSMLKPDVNGKHAIKIGYLWSIEGSIVH